MVMKNKLNMNGMEIFSNVTNVLGEGKTPNMFLDVKDIPGAP